MLVESSTPEAAKARALDHAVRESAAQYGVAEDIAEDMANIAAATGRTIEFATDVEFGAAIDGVNTVAGSYDPSTGIVKINAAATAEDARNYIIKHELVHSVEGTRQWEQLADIVQAQMGDERYSTAVAQMMEKRAASGQVLDMPAAEQEVVAEWVGDNLYKGNFAQAIVNGDATIGNAFVRTIDKLRLALGNKKSRANTQLAVVERLFMRALEQEVELREGDVQFFASTSDKSTSIKEQLREHLEEINEMEPVANISYHHIDKLTARQAVSREFKRIGNKIDRQGFGIIEIGEDEIDDSVNYIHTPAECAVWLAVPKVLKRGKLIFAKDNHKGRGHDTITIAAPVVINGTPGVMAVVVKQTGKNRYKSHRVLMPDGSVFIYQDAKNAEPTSAGMTTQTSGEGPAISSASDTRLSQNDPRVNTQSMQNAGENSHTPQNAVVNRAWMQGDTTVDRHGNAVENPVRRQASVIPSEESAATAQAPVRSQVQNGEVQADDSSVKEQLRANLGTLDKMSTVADIRMTDSFLGMNKTEKQNWVIDRLEASGYQVNRTGFGIISFAKKRLKSAFNYFKKGSAEEVVFEALPSVLENGVEISSRAEHKGRGYGTVTIAAPITINGKRGNMAAVVKRTDGNHYKVHRVLTPDGSEFTLADITNEAESTPAGESPINGSLATPINSASINSISKTPPIVKPNSVNVEALRSAQSVDDVIDAVGDEEAYRRLHFASQINRPTGTVDVDGRTMTADEYMAEQYHGLPDDEDTIRAAIKQTEAAIADELKRTVIEGGNDAAMFDLSAHPNMLKLNIQLFAQKAKLDYVLDKGEEGSKSRRFYEQRLKGKDANHNQELVDMLKGRSETYNPIANEKTLEKANARLRDAKYADKLRRRVLRYKPNDMFTDVEMAAVQVMINDAINNGELGEAADMIQGLSRKGTELGRAVQIMSMQARLTPEGTLRAMQRTLQKAADKVIGEGASDSIDQIVEEIIDAMEAKARQISSQSSAGAQAGLAADGEGGRVPVDISGATREQLRDALVEDLAETPGNYLTKKEIGAIVDAAIDQSSNIPEQVRRYIKKHIGTGTLAERIYEMQQKGHLNNAMLRRAMEESLGLPTFNTHLAKAVVLSLAYPPNLWYTIPVNWSNLGSQVRQEVLI